MEASSDYRGASLRDTLTHLHMRELVLLSSPVRQEGNSRVDRRGHPS